MGSSSKEILKHSVKTIITFLNQGTDNQGESFIIEHLTVNPGAMNGPNWHPILT